MPNKIYDFMKQNGLTTKDEASFVAEYSTPEKAKEIHSFMTKNDLTTKDFDGFYSEYFSKGAKPVGGATSGQGSNAPTTPSSSKIKELTARAVTGDEAAQQELVALKAASNAKPQPTKTPPPVMSKKDLLTIGGSDIGKTETVQTNKAADSQAKQKDFVAAPVRNVVKKAEEENYKELKPDADLYGSQRTTDDVDYASIKEKFVSDSPDSKIEGTAELENAMKSVEQDYLSYLGAKGDRNEDIEKYKFLTESSDRNSTDEKWLRQFRSDAIEKRKEYDMVRLKEIKDAIQLPEYNAQATKLVSEYDGLKKKLDKIAPADLSVTKTQIDNIQNSDSYKAYHKRAEQINQEGHDLEELAKALNSDQVPQDQRQELQKTYNTRVQKYNDAFAALSSEEEKYNQVLSPLIEKYNKSVQSAGKDQQGILSRMTEIENGLTELKNNTGATDEAIAKMQQLRGNMVLGDYMKYAGAQKFEKIANQEADYKRRLEERQKSLTESNLLSLPANIATEAFRAFSGNVGNAALSILQGHKVLGDLLGDDDYDITDRMYDWFQNQKDVRGAEYDKPNTEDMAFDDLPSFIKLPIELGEGLGSVATFAAGGSALKAVGIAENLGVMTTAFLTGEADAYQEALDAGMSKQEAATFGSMTNAVSALIEGAIPDVKYFEPSAYRKSVLDLVTSGKSTKEAIKELMPTLAESVRAYGKSAGQESGEEFVGQVGTNLSKFLANKMAGEDYYKDLLNPEDYYKATRMGVLTGPVANVMSRPMKKSPIQERALSEMIDSAESILPDLENENPVAAANLESAVKIRQSWDAIPAFQGLSENVKNHIVAESLRKEQLGNAIKETGASEETIAKDLAEIDAEVKYSLENNKIQGYDTEDKQREIPSTEREGQAPIEATIEGTSTEATSPSGDVQVDEEALAHSTVEEEQAAIGEREAKLAEVKTAFPDLSESNAEDVADYATVHDISIEDAHSVLSDFGFPTAPAQEPAKKKSESLRQKIKERAETKNKEITDAAESISKSLSGLGVKVEKIDSEAEYEARVKELAPNTEEGSQGIFVSEDGTVLLNTEKIKSASNAQKVVFHEGAHPVINVIRNASPKLYKQLTTGARAVAAKNAGVKAALDWAVSRNLDEASTEDEFITEVVARVGSGQIDLRSVPKDFKQKVVDFVNKVAKTLGMKPILGDGDTEAFKKQATKIATALRQGRDVTSVVEGKDFSYGKNQQSSDGYFISTNDSENIDTAKRMLNELGISASFTGYSKTNGVSVYFRDKNGRKIRVSNHSVSSKSRLDNETLLYFDEKIWGGGTKSNMVKNGLEAKKIKEQASRESEHNILEKAGSIYADILDKTNSFKEAEAEFKGSEFYQKLTDAQKSMVDDDLKEWYGKQEIDVEAVTNDDSFARFEKVMAMPAGKERSVATTELKKEVGSNVYDKMRFVFNNFAKIKDALMKEGVVTKEDCP